MSLQNQEVSLTDCLPIEVIGHVLSFVQPDGYFFWNYGLVCKTFLKEIAKIMKQNDMLVELKGEKVFDEHLKLILNDNDVASIMAEVGLDLSNTKEAFHERYDQIFQRCKKIRKLNLSFCELHKEDLCSLANLSMLETLNLSGSRLLGEEILGGLHPLQFFIQGMPMLTNLNLLMCENITDFGKLDI